ncbi:MAG TPA: hypothetical protein VE398_16055 [Acidobacteriota bacterium]|nr:hypothetical protein [Acidobacteriota bacterium]
MSKAKTIVSKPATPATAKPDLESAAKQAASLLKQVKGMRLFVIAVSEQRQDIVDFEDMCWALDYSLEVTEESVIGLQKMLSAEGGAK